MSDKNPNRGEKPVRPTPEQLQAAIEGAREFIEERMMRSDELSRELSGLPPVPEPDESEEAKP